MTGPVRVVELVGDQLVDGVSVGHAQQRFGVPEGDLFDATHNIDVGSRYLAHLLDRFDGDVRLAVAAYHMGPTRVARLKRENEAMGGHDPYSASKGCAELVTSSMRRCFFADGPAGVGSGRAGNVIGGGDWSLDRLLPDIVSAFASAEPVVIRRPHAVRPWQHVLEPLGGYLLLAQRLAEEGQAFATGWNFGPADTDARPVEWITRRMAERWGSGAEYEIVETGPHEAGLLRLDCSMARQRLGWRPRLELSTTLDWLVDWYRRELDGDSARDLCLEQIALYEEAGTDS